MWDRKRKIIWLVAGFAFGSFFLYPLGYDDAGLFDLGYFLQLEALLVLVMAVMFYFYSRKQ
jgi:hypothetical protein